MVETIVSPCNGNEAVHMSVRRRKISDTASEGLPRTRKKCLVPWQKLLVASLALGGTGLLTLSRYGPFALVKPQVTNTSVNSNISIPKKPMTVQTIIEWNVVSSMDETITSTYCRVSTCKTVSCSYNSKTFDAGAKTSEFLETVFKAECENTESVKLSLDNCRFPANALRKNWLSTNLSIEELKLDSCLLREIEDDAFALPIFEGTKSITLVNNKFATLRKSMFGYLISLQELTIRENTIAQAEFDLLGNLANSLTTLDLTAAIYDPRVLRNITGSGSLRKLQTLSLQGNSIPMISREFFNGVTKVKSLYLQDSNIETVSQGSFDPMASSILKLMLTNNDIPSLPNGLFDSILMNEKQFAMDLGNNPWNCNCSLKWMQDLIKSRPNIMINVPKCSTPAVNTGKSFKTAEFCQSNSTNTNMSIVETNTEPTKVSSTTSASTTAEKIAVNCVMPQFLHRKLFYSGGLRKLLTADLTFPVHSPDFFVASENKTSILINLPNDDEGVTLLWFKSDDVKGSVSCARHVRNSYQVRSIDPGASYTICLLSDKEDAVSPLNCLAARTQEANETEEWLRNADKVPAAVILTSMLTLCFLAGVFVAFAIIWKHPSLLRGSKRVMMVKKNRVEAIILPKGVSVEEQRQRWGVRSRANSKSEDDYIIPLPPAPVPPPRIPRVSRVSLQSDWNSYVSEMELAGSQSASWSLARLNSEQEKQRFDAPPLPPHPLNTVPSLSLTVTKNEEDLVYSTSSV